MFAKNNVLVLLLALVIYLSSGAISGFIQIGLPLLLQREDVLIKWVSMRMLLVLPFGISALWAPLVDRYWLVRLRHRHSWLLMMQSVIVLALLLAAVSGAWHILMVVCLAVSSFCAATIDVALDALLIETSVAEQQLATLSPSAIAIAVSQWG